jgi:hypothetical protein
MKDGRQKIEVGVEIAKKARKSNLFQYIFLVKNH